MVRKWIGMFTRAAVLLIDEYHKLYSNGREVLGLALHRSEKER